MRKFFGERWLPWLLPNAALLAEAERLRELNRELETANERLKRLNDNYTRDLLRELEAGRRSPAQLEREEEAKAERRAVEQSRVDHLKAQEDRIERQSLVIATFTSRACSPAPPPLEAPDQEATDDE